MKNLLFLLVILQAAFLNAQSNFTPESSYINALVYIDNNPELLKKDVKREVYLKENITYADHVFEASSFGIPLINNYDEMENLVLENRLIEVAEESETYLIQKLTHSRPVLLPEAYDILIEISDLFYAQTSKRLSISSLLRTTETQSRLRRVNSNATKGTSTHTFGAAFDISYSQYDGVRGRNYSYEKILQEILDEMVADGKIYYIKERRQPCFHITIRNSDLVYPDDYMLNEDDHQHDEQEEIID